MYVAKRVRCRYLCEKLKMVSKKFTVNGMTCNGCAGTVNNIIKMQKGVESVDVHYPENTAEVSFDESLISEEKIKEVVQMMGYSLN
jgi:copper chaperone CopZ